jgi:hypothetical protein
MFLKRIQKGLAVNSLGPIQAYVLQPILGPIEAYILLPIGVFWLIWIQIFLWRFLSNIIKILENTNALLKSKVNNLANGK